MIRPRSEEVKRLTAILEDESYETAEDMATELLKTCYTLFQDRNWHLWLYREGPGSPTLAFGPFAMAREAEKLAREAGLGGENYTFEVRSPAAIRARLAESNDKSKCARCSHPSLTHGWPKAKHIGCIVKKCDCEEFVK